MTTDNLNDYYKVPFRDVYCETFRVWLAEIIYCHVVLRLMPPPKAEFPPRS